MAFIGSQHPLPDIRSRNGNFEGGKNHGGKNTKEKNTKEKTQGKKQTRSRSSNSHLFMWVIVALFGIASVVPSVLVAINSFRMCKTPLYESTLGLLSFMIGVWAVLNISNLVTKKDLDNLSDTVENANSRSKELEEILAQSVSAMGREIVLKLDASVKKQISVPFIVKGFEKLLSLAKKRPLEIGRIFQGIGEIESYFEKVYTMYFNNAALDITGVVEDGRSYCNKLITLVDEMGFSSDGIGAFLKWYADFRSIDMQWYATFCTRNYAEDVVGDCIKSLQTLATLKIGEQTIAGRETKLDLLHREASGDAIRNVNDAETTQAILYLLNLIAEYSIQILQTKYKLNSILLECQDFINGETNIIPTANGAELAIKCYFANDFCDKLCAQMLNRPHAEYDAALSEMYRNHGTFMEKYTKFCAETQHTSVADGYLEDVAPIYEKALRLNHKEQKCYQVLNSLYIKCAEELLNTGDRTRDSYGDVCEKIRRKEISADSVSKAKEYAETALAYCNLSNMNLPFTNTVASINMKTHSLLAILYDNREELRASLKYFSLAKKLNDEYAAKNFQYEKQNLRSANERVSGFPLALEEL